MQLAHSDLASLSVFRAVVEHRSFLGAQVALGLSQSAVSFHMKAIEERLGFRLCRRGRGGFELTDRGAVVYERSKQLFLELSAFESDIGALKRRITGTLRLGLLDNTVTDPELPIHRIVASVHRKAPDATIHIAIKPPELLIAELGNGGLDIAILPETQTYPGLRFSLFREEPQSLYCGAAHPLFQAPRRKLTIDNVSRHWFVTRPYAKRFELQHVPDAVARTTVSSMEAQAMLVLSGLYLSYLPEHFAKAWVERHEMRALSPAVPRIFSKFFIATRTASRPSQLLDLFVQELVALGSETSHRIKGLVAPQPGKADRRKPRRSAAATRMAK